MGPNRMPYPSPEDENRFSLRNVVFSSFLEYRTMDKYKNLVILSVIHHRQNPLESTGTVQMVQILTCKSISRMAAQRCEFCILTWWISFQTGFVNSASYKFMAYILLTT
jgi:hypothetical protein